MFTIVLLLIVIGASAVLIAQFRAGALAERPTPAPKALPERGSDRESRPQAA